MALEVVAAVAVAHSTLMLLEATLGVSSLVALTAVLLVRRLGYLLVAAAVVALVAVVITLPRS